MNAAIQIAVLVLGAIFAIAGIALFAKRGISGQNTIKIAGVEFQLAGSSLVVFVVGCGLIVIAARMQTSSREETKSPLRLDRLPHHRQVRQPPSHSLRRISTGRKRSNGQNMKLKPNLVGIQRKQSTIFYV
jgi:hypothetical protein